MPEQSPYHNESKEDYKERIKKKRKYELDEYKEKLYFNNNFSRDRSYMPNLFYLLILPWRIDWYEIRSQHDLVICQRSIYLLFQLCSQVGILNNYMSFLNIFIFLFYS